MPTVEYECRTCRKPFRRLVYRGDEEKCVSCPDCGSRDISQSSTSASLFNGISPLSSLADDTN